MTCKRCLVLKQRINDLQSQLKKHNDKGGYCEAGSRIVEFFNKVCGKKSRFSSKTTLHLLSRLREGYTEHECKQVILLMNSKWKNTDMEQYIKLSTLFRRSNFGHKYLDYVDNLDNEELKDLDEAVDLYQKQLVQVKE